MALTPGKHAYLVQIPVDLFESAKTKAAAEGVPLSAVVVRLLESWIGPPVTSEPTIPDVDEW